MNTSVIQIRTEPKLKAEAMAVADDLGISLSSLIKGFLKHLAKTKRVDFTVSETPSAYLKKIIETAESEYKLGKTLRFKNSKTAIDFLKSELA